MVSTEIQRTRKAAVDEGAATSGRQSAAGSGNSPVHLLAVPGKLASAAPRAATWRGSLIVFAVASAALAWLFRAEIVAAVRVWQSSATFGHAFFITPIVIFLFYRKRHELALLAPAPAPWAIVPMAALALVWMVGEVANVLVVKQLAVVGLWQALFLLVMGWRVTQAALFPLLYLYFAVPAGSSAIPALQEVTAEMVVHLLRLTGMPVFLDGYLIQIPSGRFLVAEACSGVRYLIVSIALGVLVAHLFLRSWPRRLLFIGLSVVIPVVANGIRAYGIIMLAHLSDYRIAADVDHVFYGLIFLSIVTLSLLAIAALLREGSGPAEPAPAAPATGDSGERRKPGREILATQAVWCGAALAAVLLAQAWAASAKEAPAVLEPALLLPEAAAPWRAVSDSAALWQPRFQGPDVVLRGSYRRGTDRVDLHVAYYAYQREGAEAVSELNDLAEVGRPWRVLRLKPAEITVNGRPHRFTRMLLTDRTDTYVVWYWYRVAGENARSRLFAKLLELKALMPGAEKSASVIAIASRVSEDAERTNALLAAFLEQTLDSNGSLMPDGGRWTGR